MASGNHLYEIVVRDANVKQMVIREVLPQTLVDEVRLRRNPLAIPIITAYVLSKRPAEHPLAETKDPTALAFLFTIKEANV